MIAASARPRGGEVGTLRERSGEMAERAGVPCNKEVIEGNPSEELIRRAESGANMVVMGSVGRTGLDKFLLGSVAEKVVRNSRVPVLTVPGEKV